MRDLVSTANGPASPSSAAAESADFIDFGSGATLFGALPDGTQSSAVLLRLSVPAQGPGNDRPVRRVMGWTRLGWQPAAPRV